MDHVLWAALFNRIWENVIFKSFLRCDAIFVILSRFGFFQALFLWALFGYNSLFLCRPLMVLLHPAKEEIDCSELEAADENLFEVLDEMNQVRGNPNCLERVRQLLSQPVVRIRKNENNDEERTFLMGFDLMRMLSDGNFRMVPGSRNTILSVPGVQDSKHFTPRMRGAFSHYWNTLDVNVYGRLHGISYGSKTICGCGGCEIIGRIYYQSGDENHVFFCPSYAEYTGEVDSVVRVTIQNCRQKISYEPWIEYIFPDYVFKREYLPMAVLIERRLLNLPRKFVLRADKEIDNMSSIIDYILSRQGYTKDPNIVKHIIKSILASEFSYPEGLNKMRRSSFKRLFLLVKLAIEDLYETKFHNKIYHYIDRKYRSSISTLKINIKPKEETLFAISSIETKEVTSMKVEYLDSNSEVVDPEVFQELLETNDKFNARKSELISKYNLLDVAAESLASAEFPVRPYIVKETTTYKTNVEGVTIVWVEKPVYPNQRNRNKNKNRNKKGRKNQKANSNALLNNRSVVNNPTGVIDKNTPPRVLYDLYTTLEKAKLARSKAFKIHKLNRMLSYDDFCHNLDTFTSYRSNTLNAVRFLSGRNYDPFRKSCINKILKRSKKCVKSESRDHVEVKHHGKTVRDIYQIAQSKVDAKRSKRKVVTEGEVLLYIREHLTAMNSSALVDDVIRDLIDISKIDFE